MKKHLFILNQTKDFKDTGVNRTSQSKIGKSLDPRINNTDQCMLDPRIYNTDQCMLDPRIYNTD